MTNFMKFAGAALAALIVSTTLVQAGPLVDVKPTIQFGGPVLVDTGHANPNGPVLHGGGVVIALGCQVAGTPSEFPDDLYLVNESNGTLRAGTRVKWQVKSMGLKGYFAPASDVAAGTGIRLNGVLKGGAEAGIPCTAKVI